MGVNKSSKKKSNKIKKSKKNTERKKDLVLEEKATTNKKKDDLVEEKLNDEVINDVVEEEKLSNEEKDNVLSDNKKRFGVGCWKLILVSLSILFLILIVLFFPRIKLDGEEEINIVYNDNYVEPGYKGYIFNKDISKDIDVVSDIKEGKIGTYNVNYYYNWLGLKFKKTRIVNVIDNISPVIDVENEVLKICPKEDIPEVEYKAMDEYDGDITSRVEKIVSDDGILLKVSDLSDNLSFINIKINRTDIDKPSIKLKGNSVMFLTYGNTFKEPGYTANDNCDGDITDKVVVSGSVGRNIGSYQVKYEVIDDSGNKSSVTRKVIIGTNIKDNGNINKGTIYLTFDDGPNQGTTNKILDILKAEGVSATFFVTCNGPDNLIKRMHEEGHTVALHTASHEYSYVYSSVDNYFNDLNRVSDRVKRITGVESKIIRFPGGSSNTISRHYSKGIMAELTNIVLNDGYRYFDWNVDGMDASSARNSSDVYYNVTSNLSTNRANVVLLHDIKSITVGALKDIIKFGKEYGYNFKKIDMDTYMVRHSVNN